ncbi:MAG: hypothetical protein ACLPXM_11555 [Terriglobales bacterium]
MADAAPIPPDTNMLIFPAEITPGALAVFCPYRRIQEIRELEQVHERRTWEVRAVISDHVPLAGDAAAARGRNSYHLFEVNDGRQWIYLHSGGRAAVYYELVGGGDRRLQYIAVRVETALPSNALLLARQPLNALLDVFTRDSNMPLLIQRLELMSPRDGGLLLTQMLLPSRNGVQFGPLGGILQAVPFAPYDALYREALTSSSPFYRLLCAWKMYEGTGRIRRWIREECERRGIDERQPGDPEVDRDQLVRMGLKAEFANGITHAGQLFERLAEQRHAIAHFLIERDEGEAHVYLADGFGLQAYAIGAAVLLHYAHRVLESLRLFCIQHLPMLMRGGPMILPMPEHRDRFIVRASDFGVE